MVPVMVQHSLPPDAPEETLDIRGDIREHARAAGFEAVGFASAEADPKDQQAVAAFLKRGWHGDMDWMARAFDAGGNPRGNPKALMETARTVIVFGANYGPEHDPMAVLSRPDRGAVSVYARTQRDYHDVIKKRLKRIARWLAEEHGAAVKVFVDTAPVMEKPLAARAGIGWQGKHTNLVSRGFGSWLFLGEIFTDLVIPPDRPEPDHCGTCRACLDACPTDAFPEPYRLDATRCISYLTIEHKGMIAPELMANMGGHVYGCDDCLAACPWTKFSRPAAEPKFQPRPELEAPALSQLAAFDDDAFRAAFAGSPIRRTGRARFIRNVLIAMANSGDGRFAAEIRRLAGDADPLVGETAAWALERLGALDANAGGDNHSAVNVTHDGKGIRP